jgi:hypothetical protein
MSVYIDDAFVEGGWGYWQGGGHLQADSLEELHEFAASIGLKQAWFQKKSRPENHHYDVTAGKRALAISLGAIAETIEDGLLRRRAIRAGLR